MFSSFDFIDLDDEDISSFTSTSNFTSTSTSNFSNYPQISPPPSTKLANSTMKPLQNSLFIRSNYSPVKSRPDYADVDFIIVNIPEIGELKFNPKGPNREGRDSKVFCGELRLEKGVQKVAIKVYTEQDSPSALKEIYIAKTFTQNRSDFLKFYYSGNINGNFSSIWEWIDGGGSLDKMICKAIESKNFDFINYCIKTIATSLAYLHENKIAHHDIKPQNFLVPSDFSRVVLIDFGDSKQVIPGHLISIEEGIGLGTLAYTAPELLSRKSDLYNPLSADIYSFGVLLFFILNHGKVLPFDSLIPHRAVQMILTVQKGFFASEYNPKSPSKHPLFPLMTACLQLDPNLRPKFPELLSQIYCDLK